MRRQALQQAAGVARQAATLAEAAREWPCSRIARSLQASTVSLGAAEACGGQHASPVLALASQGSQGHPAAAAAALQPWRQVQAHRGVHSWPARLDPPQQQVPQGHGWQQRRAASAQAQPSSITASEAAAGGGAADGPSSSSSSSSSEGLALSDAAVERLKELQAQSSGQVMLRVTVEGGGCSGFQYEFAIDESGVVGDTDRLFERDGMRVVCDDISLEFLKGAIVDYESDLMRSAFVVGVNPNAASSCGCGSSFVAKQ